MAFVQKGKSIFSISIIALVIIAITPSFSAAQSARDTSDFNNFDYYVRKLQSSVAKISCGESQGTSFIVRLAKVADVFFAITNKHVLQDKSDVSIAIPLGKEAGIDTTILITTKIEFRRAKGTFNIKTGTTVIWPELDIAAITIELKSLSKLRQLGLGEIRFLDPENFTQWEDLIPGQTINFTGFPLGRASAGKYPLLRSGVIAGIDRLGDTVFVDGQFFGGSSGSPIFLDLRDPACRLPYSADRYFVGVVVSHVPHKKFFRNTETKKIEMVQTENSGIGIVIPSATLYNLLINLKRVPGN